MERLLQKISERAKLKAAAITQKLTTKLHISEEVRARKVKAENAEIVNLRSSEIAATSKLNTRNNVEEAMNSLEDRPAVGLTDA